MVWTVLFFPLYSLASILYSCFKKKNVRPLLGEALTKFHEAGLSKGKTETMCEVYGEMFMFIYCRFTPVTEFSLLSDVSSHQLSVHRLPQVPGLHCRHSHLCHERFVCLPSVLGNPPPTICGYQVTISLHSLDTDISFTPLSLQLLLVFWSESVFQDNGGYTDYYRSGLIIRYQNPNSSRSVSRHKMEDFTKSEMEMLVLAL